MRLTASDFIKGSARIQRLQHAGQIMAGVLDELSVVDAKIRCTTDCDLQRGEKLFVEVQKQGRALFMASLAEIGEPFSFVDPVEGPQVGRHLSLVLRSPIRFYDGRRSGRVLRALSVKVVHPTGSFYAATADVSSCGIGLLAPLAIKVGAQLFVTIDTRSGVIECPAFVRFCRKDPSFNGFYRLGVELPSLTQADTVRLIGQLAA